MRKNMKKLFGTHLWLLSFVIVFFLLISFVHGQSANVSMSFTIVNSYTGTVELNTWGLLFQSGFYYSASNDVDVVVSGSDTSMYYFSWDVVAWQFGGWSGAYIINDTVTTTPWDGLKTIVSYFLKGLEQIDPALINVIIDATPPSQPWLLSPIDGSLFATWSSISFEWIPSVDSWVGLDDYSIVFFGSPSATVPDLVYQTTNTWAQISWVLLSPWTLYWAVQAVDKLGNTSTTPLRTLYNGFVTPPPALLTGWWGGGWWSTLRPDYCPDWDFSGSRYDFTCDGVVNTQNPTVDPVDVVIVDSDPDSDSPTTTGPLGELWTPFVTEPSIPSIEPFILDQLDFFVFPEIIESKPNTVTIIEEVVEDWNIENIVVSFIQESLFEDQYEYIIVLDSWLILYEWWSSPYVPQEEEKNSGLQDMYIYMFLLQHRRHVEPLIIRRNRKKRKKKKTS